ncbi:The fantastic four family [Macleaya cordata]|uniref:The fantastic four family n=1 Tax=Macleaya cordata TaxID=56857 RepID=A0A200Q8B2_MACCD|nr:The fantastic four family [Macleaya cordata]
MSSMLCQGLQSCLEPRFVEPRALGLKLAPPKPFFSRTMEWARKSCTSDSDSDSEEQNTDNNINNNNDDIDTNKTIGGWSLIEALTNSSQSPINEANKEKESPYVHPLLKRYSSKLSEKSLELCTENLGCETGTDISENSDISSTTSSDSESGRSPTRDRQKLRHNWGMSKKVNSGSFPPPLTSISGSNCVQVRPHREGGRLVIKTVVVPSPQTFFQAERRDGRLRLHILKNFDSSTIDTEFEEDVEEEENYDAKEEEQEQKQEQKSEPEQEIEIEDEKEEDQDQDIDVEKDYLDEEMEGNNGNVGGEMGIEKFQRPRRCNESGRGKNGLLIWEPFWVAT